MTTQKPWTEDGFEQEVDLWAWMTSPEQTTNLWDTFGPVDLGGFGNPDPSAVLRFEI